MEHQLTVFHSVTIIIHFGYSQLGGHNLLSMNDSINQVVLLTSRRQVADVLGSSSDFLVSSADDLFQLFVGEFFEFFTVQRFESFHVYYLYWLLTTVAVVLRFTMRFLIDSVVVRSVCTVYFRSLVFHVCLLWLDDRLPRLCRTIVPVWVSVCQVCSSY